MWTKVDWGTEKGILVTDLVGVRHHIDPEYQDGTL